VATLRLSLEKALVLVLIVWVTSALEVTAIHGAASMVAHSLPKKESAVVVQA
jgi:hypothetical protein